MEMILNDTTPCGKIMHTTMRQKYKADQCDKFSKVLI